MAKAKLCLAAIILCSQAYAGLTEEYGDTAGLFLGYCQGANYLKEKYCPDGYQPTLESCFNLALNELPARYRNEFRVGVGQAIREREFLDASNSAIEDGYRGALKKYSGDKKTACHVWHGAVLQYQVEKIKKLRELSKQMK